MLRELPAVVEERPLMHFAPPDDWAALDVAVDRAERYQAVAFTSPRAARAFMRRLAERSIRWETLGARRPDMWTSGTGTMRGLEDALGPVRASEDVSVGQLGAAEALARAMIAA